MRRRLHGPLPAGYLSRLDIRGNGCRRATGTGYRSTQTVQKYRFASDSFMPGLLSHAASGYSAASRLAAPTARAAVIMRLISGTHEPHPVPARTRSPISATVTSGWRSITFWIDLVVTP